jgi:threonine aldolase
MRQVGVLAGPGLVALREMPAKLHRDHEMAVLLAQKLSQNKSIVLEYVPKTNMMHFRLTNTTKSVAEIEAAMKVRRKEKGIFFFVRSH